jgi:transposase
MWWTGAPGDRRKVDVKEKVVVRKQLRRSQVLVFFKALPPYLVGMEACATSRCWARELTKLGHQVQLMPAKDVAYVSRNTTTLDGSSNQLRASAWDKMRRHLSPGIPVRSSRRLGIGRA